MDVTAADPFIREPRSRLLASISLSGLADDVVDYGTGIGLAGELYSKATGKANPINGALDSVTGALTPASTAGVQQAASDAQNIQNAFLAQYQGLQPWQSPAMNPAYTQAAQMGNATANAAAPVSAASAQAAQINAAQANQDRAAQLALAQSLQGTINGTTPSVAQLQQNLAFQQLAAQQAGLAAAAGRGGNQALAMRTAMQNQSNLGAQQAAQAALLRAQETATAQGQLGGVLSGVAGNDLGLATNQAGLTQQASLTNAQLQQQAALQNQANTQQANLTNAQLQQQAMQQNTQNAQQTALANQQANMTSQANNQAAQLQTTNQYINQQQNLGALTNQANANQVNAQVGALNAQTAAKAQQGNLLSTGITAAALSSDRRLKTDVRPASASDLHAAMSAMHGSDYAYKANPAVRHTSPMAQNLEKTAIGKSLVRDTPRGKAIDLPSAAGALMAMVSDLHRRVGQLEGGRKAA